MNGSLHMSTHAPPDNNMPRSIKRRRIAIALGLLGAAGIAVCVAAAISLWSFASSPDLLRGTDLTEKDLSRARQIALVNEYSPLAIPASAGGIKIEYQRFQDWNFKATFTLPPRDFKSWTARLKRRKTQPASDGILSYEGKRIGAFSGYVTAEPKPGRITIFHSSS
jgi:hypothetical protein